MEKESKKAVVILFLFLASCVPTGNPVSLDYARSEVALQRLAMDVQALSRDKRLDANAGVKIYALILASDRLLGSAREALKEGNEPLAASLVASANALNAQAVAQLQQLPPPAPAPEGAAPGNGGSPTPPTK